jgi:TPR repeat protein
LSGAGSYVQEPFKLSKDLEQKSADQGNAQAQYNLGVCYAQGLGVTRDDEQAVYWVMKAADQGFQDAINALQSAGIH